MVVVVVVVVVVVDVASAVSSASAAFVVLNHFNFLLRNVQNLLRTKIFCVSC